jgi:hypothetical protein
MRLPAIEEDAAALDAYLVTTGPAAGSGMRAIRPQSRYISPRPDRAA